MALVVGCSVFCDIYGSALQWLYKFNSSDCDELLSLIFVVEIHVISFYGDFPINTVLLTNVFKNLDLSILGYLPEMTRFVDFILEFSDFAVDFSELKVFFVPL